MDGDQRQRFFLLGLGAWLPGSGDCWSRRGSSLLPLFPLFPLFLVLALLFAQQLAFTHGYRHLSAGYAAQTEVHHGAHDATQQGSQHPRPTPAAWHDCALCVATGGLHLFVPPPAATLPALAAAPPALPSAVPPAPTFFFPAAYLSRAPPITLN